MKGLPTTQILNNIQELLNELKTRVLIEDQTIAPKPRKSVHIDFTPDMRRKNAIEKAKEIISHKNYMTKQYDMVFPEFIINYNKKTVVALMKGINSKKIRARGKAQCDPSDVFNIDIGKAIALTRALEHHVPEFLLKAPNPTKIEVGDIIGFKDDPGHELNRYKVLSTDFEVNDNLLMLTDHLGNSSNGVKAYGGQFDWAKITDDSKE